VSHRNSINTDNLFLFRLCSVLLAFAIITSIVPAVRAVERDLLWLPRNYNHHYKTLYRAATTVEQHERCVKVIAASLSESESNIEHPVFNITCRDQERRSFVAKVDGFTNEILNLPPSLSEESVELEPEIELSPEEAAQLAHQAKLDEHWQLCYSQVERRARHLNLLEWLHEGQLEPVEESETTFLYHVDFNARSSSGEQLAYRAHCEFKEGVKNIEIHARKLSRIAADNSSDENKAEGPATENSVEDNN